jgi:hypothetical protein
MNYLCPVPGVSVIKTTNSAHAHSMNCTTDNEHIFNLAASPSARRKRVFGEAYKQHNKRINEGLMTKAETLFMLRSLVKW